MKSGRTCETANLVEEQSPSWVQIPHTSHFLMTTHKCTSTQHGPREAFIGHDVVIEVEHPTELKLTTEPLHPSDETEEATIH